MSLSAEEMRMWVARSLCLWFGCWWLNADDLLPCSREDTRPGDVFCPRCGTRHMDWRGWI